MKVAVAEESFPELGTVANPAVLFDGNNAFVCYEASAAAGGGNVVLEFGNVIDFRIAPLNVEGLREYRYPIQPWAFNEIWDSEETTRWKVLSPRFWLLSFNDVTIEILFKTVSVIGRGMEVEPQDKTLINALSN
ncbi:hypothetical protein ACU5AY_08820 [Rhizobium sp. PAMB 3174]